MDKPPRVDVQIGVATVSSRASMPAAPKKADEPPQPELLKQPKEMPVPKLLAKAEPTRPINDPKRAPSPKKVPPILKTPKVLPPEPVEKLPEPRSAIQEPEKLPPPLAKKPEALPKPKQAPVPPMPSIADIASPASTNSQASTGAKDKHPRLVTNIAPVYPADALRNRHEGVVLLAIRLNDRGGVDEVRVERSSGYPALDQAAVNAARTWRYEVGIKNGTPVYDFHHPVDFYISNYLR